jgi:hypothetical protein
MRREYRYNIIDVDEVDEDLRKILNGFDRDERLMKNAMEH